MFYSLIVPDVLLHKVLVNELLSNKTGDLLGLTLPELLYTGKYSPLFYFRPLYLRCQGVNLRLGEL